MENHGVSKESFTIHGMTLDTLYHPVPSLKIGPVGEPLILGSEYVQYFGVHAHQKEELSHIGKCMQLMNLSGK